MNFFFKIKRVSTKGEIKGKSTTKIYFFSILAGKPARDEDYSFISPPDPAGQVTNQGVELLLGPVVAVGHAVHQRDQLFLGVLLEKKKRINKNFFYF